MNRLPLFWIGLLLGGTAVGSQTADTIYHNGSILTMAGKDTAFPEQPVMVLHVSLHGAVLNSASMKKYNFTAATEVPPGGIIVRKPGIKVTIDGSPQGRTAHFTTPYLTGGPNGEKDWKGEPTFPEPEIRRMAIKDINVVETIKEGTTIYRME